jgi:Uma2 family endonuclease
MTTATDLTARPVIEYPESDGLPMSDNTLQFRWISTIMWGLDIAFSHNRHVFVAGNLLWYPVQGEPTIRIGPDVLVALGRPRGERGSYKQWEEGNVAPQVIIEVLSPGNRPAAMNEKFAFYERFGVEEYYVYDPDDGSLQGFVSPRLQVRFEPGPGADNLKIFGPDGAPFLTVREWAARSEQDRQRADEQASLAHEQTRIAQTERERADRLAARLRELGIDLE